MEAIDIISKLKKSAIDRCRERIESEHNKHEKKEEYSITSRLKKERLF